MINIIKNLFHKGHKASIVKRFIDNPEDFILTMEVVNDEIVIVVKKKVEDPES